MSENVFESENVFRLIRYLRDFFDEQALGGDELTTGCVASAIDVVEEVAQQDRLD